MSWSLSSDFLAKTYFLSWLLDTSHDKSIIYEVVEILYTQIKFHLTNFFHSMSLWLRRWSWHQTHLQNFFLVHYDWHFIAQFRYVFHVHYKVLSVQSSNFLLGVKNHDIIYYHWVNAAGIRTRKCWCESPFSTKIHSVKKCNLTIISHNLNLIQCFRIVFN